MITSNKINFTINEKISLNTVAKIYFSKRQELKTFIKQINSHILNNSRSFFLALYYMDLIFINDNLETIFFSHFSPYDYQYGYSSKKELPMRFYYLMSLSCLIVASKFYENDPHVPNLSTFIALSDFYSKDKQYFDLEEVNAGEVITLKVLNYQLKYYSLYH